ncbi:MAG: type VI secretion system baseplate subunit TssF [Paracoccaceae bacterium]|nr:MAG: type VI secretion system baseplate subunit TssF [Paracoccaceae bacterium]
MDTRLLRHYENELAYLRDMGGEFSRAYPKIAARLGMSATEVIDPYVERLLEGVAFLSARVQLELELQYPSFTQHLLEIVYPHYLAPTPSMMIAAFTPDASAQMKDGYTLPRGTALRSVLGEDDQTACQFRTAHDVTLWPITISEAEYIDGRGGLVAVGLGRDVEARAGIRLRLKCLAEAPLAALSLDRLTLFFTGIGGRHWQMHEMFCTQVTGLAGRSTDRRADWVLDLKGGVTSRGYDPEEALLPRPKRSYDGYRLLQEYFGMPQRFHFVDINGLSPAIKRAAGHEVDIYILLRDGNPDIAAAITPEAFHLFATPAVNLFPKRCDRLLVTRKDTDHHVVPDRTAPHDYEVHSIEEVLGISEKGEDDLYFRPFYSSDDFTAAGDSWAAYYTQFRRMRQLSDRERRRGEGRSSYLGSELYITLVDPAQAPFPGDLAQIAVQALCTNRDLPMFLPTGGANVFHLPDGGPITQIATPVSPTAPRPSLGQGDSAWRLISHLSLNYLSIADTEQGGGVQALRELVGIYAPTGKKDIEKQIEGMVSIDSRPIVRRMADGLMSTAVRGLEIRLTFDDSFFEGTSAYLLGSVLERFFRRYVTINSFTETVLHTQQRGEIARWKPDRGLGRII